MEHDFLPRDEGAWSGRDTRHGTIRLTCPAGDDTELIVLTPAGACQDTVRFGMNTLSAVIIAALQAAGAAILACSPRHEGSRAAHHGPDAPPGAPPPSRPARPAGTL